MAKQMAFTSPDGTAHPVCYWRIVSVNISVADHSALIVFYGYHDATSRAAGKASVQGALKTYFLSGDDFDKMMAAHLAPNGPNIMALGYQRATITKDVIVDPVDPTKNVGFFDTATDV